MLKLEIVTPERKVIDTDVDSVTVPLVNGEAGILPEHAPLISAVKPGIVSYAVKGSSEMIVVSSGFVEVSGGKVAILVDSAELANEIDLENAKAAKEEAERTLAAASQNTIEDNELLHEAFQHAMARVTVAR